jgi:hypothetical protein
LIKSQPAAFVFSGLTLLRLREEEENCMLSFGFGWSEIEIGGLGVRDPILESSFGGFLG